MAAATHNVYLNKHGQYARLVEDKIDFVPSLEEATLFTKRNLLFSKYKVLAECIEMPAHHVTNIELRKVELPF